MIGCLKKEYPGIDDRKLTQMLSWGFKTSEASVAHVPRQVVACAVHVAGGIALDYRTSGNYFGCRTLPQPSWRQLLQHRSVLRAVHTIGRVLTCIIFLYVFLNGPPRVTSWRARKKNAELRPYRVLQSLKDTWYCSSRSTHIWQGAKGISAVLCDYSYLKYNRPTTW